MNDDLKTARKCLLLRMDSSVAKSLKWTSWTGGTLLRCQSFLSEESLVAAYPRSGDELSQTTKVSHTSDRIGDGDTAGTNAGWMVGVRVGVGAHKTIWTSTHHVPHVSHSSCSHLPSPRALRVWLHRFGCPLGSQGKSPARVRLQDSHTRTP